MAVKLADASSRLPLYGRVFDVSEREQNVLRVVLGEPPRQRTSVGATVFAGRP